MSFGNHLSRRRRPGVSAQTEALKEAARATLDLDETVMVSVSELACHEPGCPDVETVIAVLVQGAPPRLARIHKPLKDATPDDVADAFAADPSRPPGPS